MRICSLHTPSEDVDNKIVQSKFWLTKENDLATLVRVADEVFSQAEGFGCIKEKTLLRY